jgi:hypothetical protein
MVTRLDNDRLYNLVAKLYNRLDRLMSESCSGGLSFGWDMPTAWVFFPGTVALFRWALQEAACRRLPWVRPSKPGTQRLLFF